MLVYSFLGSGEQKHNEKSDWEKVESSENETVET